MKVSSKEVQVLGLKKQYFLYKLQNGAVEHRLSERSGANADGSVADGCQQDAAG